MTCQTLQNRILVLPDPRRVTEPIRAHLTDCAECREWCVRAGRLEELLAQLPVPQPPLGKKTKLIVELNSPQPTPAHRPVPAQPNRRLSPTIVRYVAALAAMVMLVVGGWQLFSRPKVKVEVAAAPRHPLLDKIVRRDIDLARAQTPEKRLEVLGGLANDLQSETRSLALVARADELKDVARWFDKVVQGGIVKQAKNLPDRTLTPSERNERTALISKLAGQLGQTAREAQDAARQAPPDAQEALRRIADSATDGQKKLNTLSGGV